ncbi:MAG: DNA sulfur modification protein DndB [Candidatus Dormibacteria bacterium]
MSDQPSGYSTEDSYFATRFMQGTRVVYSLELALEVAAASLPRPDPHHPMPGNRRVNANHAHRFAQYIRDQPEWVAPAVLLRGPDIFAFHVRERTAATEFGLLALPRLARTDLRILDGQHRILGLNYLVEDLARELEQKRSLLNAAKHQSNPELMSLYQDEIGGLERLRRRLHDESIAVQILVEDDVRAAEQMFVDIADNALGITSAIRARFDDRKVVNRCLDEVLNHALLKGRVDMEQDRIGLQSPYLLGAKHVTDMIRTLQVGIGGRIGRRLEVELNEGALVERTNNFLDVVVGAFPDLESVSDGFLTPFELRSRSLLGSATMLRTLAGAYHDLTNDYQDEEIRDRFAALTSMMAAPVGAHSPWLRTQSFLVGGMAPLARGQNMRAVVDTLIRWSTDPQTIHEHE